MSEEEQKAAMQKQFNRVMEWTEALKDQEQYQQNTARRKAEEAANSAEGE